MFCGRFERFGAQGGIGLTRDLSSDLFVKNREKRAAGGVVSGKIAGWAVGWPLANPADDSVL
jgi:hypothetical protein